MNRPHPTRVTPASPAPRRPGWGADLGAGTAGIALLHIHRARTGLGDWDTAHRWAAAMTRAPITAHAEAASLYRGAPAVAFTLHVAGHPAYAGALATLDPHIAGLTRRRLAAAHRRIEQRQPTGMREYDLISGLTGLGVYLLRRHGDAELTRAVLDYLVRLTQPLHRDGQPLPGWWCGAGPPSHEAAPWGGGHGNLGIAHGIAGPLALLATAARHDITVTGHHDAIGRICDWLEHWRRGDPERAWWPETLSLPEARTGNLRQPGPGRPSWCYGTPGLARAQQLAALALGDPHRQHRAEQALIGCLDDEHQLGQLSDASLCHGWAGLAHTTYRAAGDSLTGELAERLPRLHRQMTQHTSADRLNGAGLLEGDAGLGLVNDTITHTPPPSSSWDGCLLLTG